MNIIQFVDAPRCKKFAKKFTTNGKPYEMYVDESLNERRFTAEQIEALARKFEAAAERGGEYLSNIVKDFCWLHGLNDSEFAKQL